MQRKQTNLKKETSTDVMLETIVINGKGIALGMNRQEERRQKSTENLLEEVLSKDNMLQALHQVQKNKGAGGVDGMKTEELTDYLIENWIEIRASITECKYKPAPVRKAERLKDDGSKRMLGIPTVLDRTIQQAISQKLVELYDHEFSENSYGFRPGRDAKGAVKRAKEYIDEGYEVVVDLDIEKFFDRVNHDYLMSLIGKKVQDRKLRILIRKYLQAGIMEEGLATKRTEGMPQGSPLSPVLSNILLDELDKELEKRGHRFVRYADDCSIYTRTERAGQRIIESIGKFIETKLKLKLNQSKSGVRKPDEMKILGYSFLKTKTGNWKIRVSKKSKSKLKEKIRELTERGGAKSMSERIKTINSKITGWGHYFKLTELKSDFQDIDGFIRNRLRMCQWHDWKRIRTRIRELQKLKVKKDMAIKWGNTRKGYARTAQSQILKTSLNNRYFQNLGYKELVLILK